MKHSIAARGICSTHTGIKGICLALVAFLTALLSAGAVFSEGSGFPVESRDTLVAIQFNDAGSGWLVGNKGLILSTKDSGKTWEKAPRITKKALNDVTFIDGEGWVVGHGGVILHSSDGGRSWKEQESNAEETLMCVFFLDRKRGIAVGQAGIILNTEDGGSSWTENHFDLVSALPESFIEHGIYSLSLYDVYFLESGTGWIVGDNGLVLFSSDGGSQWEVFRIGFFPALYTVFFKDESMGFAAGQNGLLLSTVDGGRNWETLESHTKYNLYKICMHGDDGIVSGDNGTLLRTKDGGKIWSAMEMELSTPFPSFIDAAIVGPVSSKKLVFLVGGPMVKSIHIN
jgi:photosystem II stability/assembly factor-like uncharacterized protein